MLKRLTKMRIILMNYQKKILNDLSFQLNKRHS